MMLFSLRYHRALQAGTLLVEIPDDCWRKLWAWLRDNNEEYYVRRDKHDNWADRSTALDEAGYVMLTEQGYQLPSFLQLGMQEYVP